MRISELLHVFMSACPVLPPLRGSPLCAQSLHDRGLRQHQEAVGGPGGELTAWLQVTAIPDMGIVSSSLDGTILVAEAASGRILSRICVHSQGAPSTCAAPSMSAAGPVTFPILRVSGGPAKHCGPCRGQVSRALRGAPRCRWASRGACSARSCSGSPRRPLPPAPCAATPPPCPTSSWTSKATRHPPKRPALLYWLSLCEPREAYRC